MDLATIFTATPAKIDIAIAEVSAQIDRQHQIQDHADHQINYRYATAADKKAGLQSADAAFAKLTVLEHLLHGLQAEHNRRGGWSRVYAVNNSNGHFHRTTACRNAFVTTGWVWMPELSGLTDAEVVERTGKMSCLTCFGSQREEIEKGREATVFTPAQQKSREEQATAAAQRAAKQAKAAASAITNPDGTPLLDRVESPLKTVRAAWIDAVDNLVWAEYSEYMIELAPQHLEGEKLEQNITNNRSFIQEHNETAFRIAKALAHKTGRDLVDVLNEIVAKADKKIQKNRKDR
jgi:hypothetical protein